MKLMKGDIIAQKGLLEIEKKIKEKRISLSLAVVQVGKSGVAETYIKKKKEALEKIGIPVSVYRFHKSTSSQKIKETIRALGEKGIIVQLPLPAKLNTQDILETIPPEKDVDLLTSNLCGKFYTGTTNLLPPVVRAVDILSKEYDISWQGKEVVLIGSGRLVGRPLSLFLAEKKATVLVLNRHTPDIAGYTKKADVVISGTGNPFLLKGSMVKKGAIIMDAGAGILENKVRGDIDKSAYKKAALASPVPGGIGPLAVYSLAYNLFLLYDRDR